MNMYYACSNFYRRTQLAFSKGRAGDLVNWLDCWCSWRISSSMFPFYFPFCDLYAHGFYPLTILAFILLREFRSLHIFKLISLISHCTCIYMPFYDQSCVCSIKNLSFVPVFIMEQVLSYTYLWQPVAPNSYPNHHSSTQARLYHFLSSHSADNLVAP